MIAACAARSPYISESCRRPSLLWQQQYENDGLESEVTSGQRKDVQRLLQRASNFRDRLKQTKRSVQDGSLH